MVILFALGLAPALLDLSVLSIPPLLLGLLGLGVKVEAQLQDVLAEGRALEELLMERHADVGKVVIEGFLADAAKTVGLGGPRHQLTKHTLTSSSL